MAVFLSIAFLGQIFSIFSAFELRYRINAEHWPRGETDKNMKLYNTDSDVQHNWDVMQRDLRSETSRRFHILRIYQFLKLSTNPLCMGD